MGLIIATLFSANGKNSREAKWTTSSPGSLVFPPPGAREGREDERPWGRGCTVESHFVCNLVPRVSHGDEVVLFARR